MNIVLSNKIRVYRFNNGEMSQQELANRVNCTRQTINTLEAGKYTPSLILAYKIAKIFGVGIEEVFQFNENE